MAVRLRMMRVGKRNRPYYRICALDSRRPRDGAYLENLGHYDPYLSDDKMLHVHKDRIEYWLSVGAKPSETLKYFFKRLQIAPARPPESKSPKSKKKRRRKPRPKARGPKSLSQTAAAAKKPGAPKAAASGKLASE
jgi:small subunit ribosomal protein S16